MASKPGRKVSKRNDLTLQQKFKVIKAAEKDKKLGVRKLSQMFNCGKTQISGVLKNKAKIEELYMANVSEERYHIGKRVRESKYSELNDLYTSTYWQCPKISSQMVFNLLKNLSR